MLPTTIRSYWGGTLSNRNSGDFAENSGGGKDIKKKKIVATTLPLDSELYWTHCSEEF